MAGFGIKFSHIGDLSKTYNFLRNLKVNRILRILNRYGEDGVRALSSATPKDSGRTASSWYYEIESDDDSVSIVWKNSNVNHNVPIAIIIQYGHATGTGGYVQGRDYINPAIAPIFDKAANEAWKEVTKL